MLNATLSEKVFAALREQILNGTYHPGDRLLYLTIAEELSVSLTPVKEALLRLEKDGLVEIKPRKGAFVTRISDADAVEYTRIRLALESLAADLIVERGGLSAKDGSVMRGINGQLMQAILDRDTVACISLDIEYHAALVNSCGNRRLVETVQRMPLANLSMIVGANDYFVENGMKIGQTHAAIIDALERGNAELAKKCLRENIMEPLQQIIAKV